MKILQIVHGLPFHNQAGTEIYTLSLSLELSRKHEVYIFCRTSDTKQKDYEITKSNYGKITVYSINNTFRDCNSFEMLYDNEMINTKFNDLLDEIKPDIVHIQNQIFLSIGIIGKIKEKNIPLVFTLHDYWLMCPRWHLFRKNNKPCEEAVYGKFNQGCIGCLEEMINLRKGNVRMYMISKILFFPFILKALKRMWFFYIHIASNSNSNINKLKDREFKIRSLLDMVDIFLAPSEFIRNRFIEFGLPKEKIEIFRFGFNNNLFLNHQKFSADRIRFAFIGTLLPAKGLHTLINAFNRIDTKKADLKIYAKLRTYAGFEDYLPNLKKIVKNRNIKFMDEFDHTDIARIFHEIDILVVPSLWYENSPLVIQEAFLFRTPVLASDIGGIPELVKDSINGFLFKAGDIEDLQEKLQYIIGNPDVISKFQENISMPKSMEDHAREIEELYTLLINKDNVINTEPIFVNH